MTRFVGTPLRGIEFSNPSDEALSARVVNDAHARIRIDAGGRLTWSSGSATGDVNLYRYDINVLKTDDAFQAVGGVTTLTTAGIPTASSPDGTIAVDTDNDVFYYRSGGEWLQVSSGASVVISATEPVGATSGDLWFNSSNLVLYILNGATWVSVSGSLTLGELDDVSISGLESGHILKYDGTNWVNDLADSGYNAHTELIGDGVTSDIVVTHNFNTRDIVVQCRNAESPYESIEVGWEATSLNTVTLKFATPPQVNSIRANIYAGIGAQGVNAFSQTIGDGILSSFVLEHDFNTRDIVISARNAVSPYEAIEINWEATTVDTVTVYFSTIPDPDSVRVTVYAGGGVAGVTSILGTANEITVSANNGTVQVGLPDNVALSGTPTAPTAAPGTDTTQIATTAFVQDAVGSFASNLDGLSDVSITAPSGGDVLQYVDGNWINGSITLGSNTTGNYVATISGTVNQVSVAGSGSETASVTLSLPQDIATTSSVEFADVTISGSTGLVMDYVGENLISFGTTAPSWISGVSGSVDGHIYLRAGNQPASMLSILANGNIGINTTSPTSTLHVVGASFIDGNLVVSGDLTVNGTTTTINTTELLVEDNVVTLNANTTGAPTTNAGIEVERGTSPNVLIQWNETADKWELSNNGVDSYPILTTNNSVGDLVDVNLTGAVVGEFLKFDGTNFVNTTDGLIPTAGLEGQILAKTTDANYDVQWIDNYAQEMRYVVKNDSGSTITKFTVVAASGAVGDTIRVVPFINNGSVPAEYILGIASEDILNGETGYVTAFGPLQGLDTLSLGWALGTILYASSATAGSLTSTRPLAPSIDLPIAIVTKQASNGRLFVRMWSQGQQLEELYNVSIASQLTGQTVKWNGSLWENGFIALGTDTTGNYVSGVSAGTGISVSHTPSEGSTATISLDAALNDLNDVDTTGVISGQFLKYNGTSWVADSVPTINALDDIGDVAIVGATTGQVLKYNGTVWTNDTDNAGTTINSLDDVGDVTITSIASGQFLKWSGSAWVNDTIDLGTDTTGNYVVSVNGSSGAISNIAVTNATNTFSASQVITASSSDAILRITQTGAGNALVVEDDTNPDATPFVIAADGTTGIGTSSPTARLHVRSSSTSETVLRVVGQRFTTQDLIWAGDSTNTSFVRVSYDGRLIFGSGDNTTTSIGILKIPSGYSTSSGVSVFAGASSGTTSVVGYESILDANTGTSLTSSTQFYAKNGSLYGTATLTNYYGFRVDAISIGTNRYGFYGNLAAASNSWNLYMNGTAANYLAGRLGVGATLTSGAMLQVTNTTAADNAFVIKGAASQSGLLFDIENSSSTSLVVVDSSGNLGVGTSSPQTKVDIDGVLTVRNATYLKNNVVIQGTTPGTMNLYVDGRGSFGVASTDSTTSLIVKPLDFDEIGIVVKGIGAHYASLQEWQDFNGNVLMSVGATGDVTIAGNLTVNGTTTTLNTAELLVEDNIITLNSGVTASPSLNAGIEVERGTSDNVQIRWNESTDKWQFTNDGTTYKDLGSGGITVSDTAPSSPAQGDMWYESDTGSTYVYYDSYWVEIGGAAAIANGSITNDKLADGVLTESKLASQTLVQVTGATYIPTLADRYKMVIVDTTSGAVTITINSSLGLAPGDRIEFMWQGAATSVTFAGSGVTLNSTPGLKLRTRYSAASLVCTGINTYVLIGDLSA